MPSKIIIFFNISIVEGRGGSSGIFHVVLSKRSPVIGSSVCCTDGINLFLPRLPPSLFPNNGTCSSVVVCGLVLLFAAVLPAALPTTPPTIPLTKFAVCELPNAELVPAATPEPILAPKIVSPAPIKPAVPPINNASPAADAPPVNAAVPIVPAIVSIF